MLETTAQGLSPWAEQGCDRAAFHALLVLESPDSLGCRMGQVFPCPSTANPHMKLPCS